jgi:hypothetical protein
MTRTWTVCRQLSSYHNGDRRWDQAVIPTGAPPGWSRPPSSSAVSTATCTYQPFVQRWRLRPLAPSHPRARVRRWSKRPEGHRAATEVPRNSGHPPPPAYLLDSYNVHDNVICATTSHATGVVSDNGTNFATARSASAATPSRPPASCSWPMIAAAAVRL